MSTTFTFQENLEFSCLTKPPDPIAINDALVD